jgi:hypothetical protein
VGFFLEPAWYPLLVLRPSGSLLASSRAVRRRSVLREWLRGFSVVPRRVAAAIADVCGAGADLLVLLGLPLLYPVAAFLALDLPARFFAGRAGFSALGFFVFLGAWGVTLYGAARAARGAPPVAPVRPKFAKAMLLVSWAAALLLTLADLAG